MNTALFATLVYAVLLLVGINAALALVSPKRYWRFVRWSSRSTSAKPYSDFAESNGISLRLAGLIALLLSLWVGADLASSLLRGTLRPIPAEAPNASPGSHPSAGWSGSEQLSGIVFGVAMIVLGATCLWKPEPVVDWLEDSLPQDVTPRGVKRMGAVLIFVGAALLFYATIGQLG